jgi:hypothetical protein
MNVVVPGSSLTQFGINGTQYCGPGYSAGGFGNSAIGSAVKPE